MDVVLTEDIVVLLNSIEKKLGKLESEIVIDLHLRKENKIKSIHSSLAIEQNSLSIEQVTAIIEGERVLGVAIEIQEVKNAFEIYEQFNQLNPYSQQDLLYAHKILTKEIIASSGSYRNNDVGIFTDTGKVVHMGARPDFIYNLMTDLFTKLSESRLSPVIKACIFHYELELIHPFADGNGRMGRLWQNLILSKYSPVFEFLTIETLIYEHQEEYYAVLQESDETGEASHFAEFMLDLINSTLSEFTHSRIIELNQSELDAYNQLLEYLKQEKRITTSNFAKLIDKAPATSRRYMNKYAKLNLLESHGQNKDRFYTL
ncbi:Fic family protein [Mollicutes bacterium LVI A0078]|nr:Fic family protein [Mollicutes bacterium LVI A0078]